MSMALSLASVPASAPSARTSLSSTPSPAVPTFTSMAATSRAVVRWSASTMEGMSSAGPVTPFRLHPSSSARRAIDWRDTANRPAIAVTLSALRS